MDNTVTKIKETIGTGKEDILGLRSGWIRIARQYKGKIRGMPTNITKRLLHLS